MNPLANGRSTRCRPTSSPGFATRLGIIATMAATLLVISGDRTPLTGQSLRGSVRSLDVQNRMARQHDFTYIDDGAQVRRFVAGGYLVRVSGDANFRLDNEVSYPFARPEVRTFLRRLGRQYRAACGEQLVVTSLTRPQTRQPRNASDRSVHPTGMAVDLRRTNHMPCRRWLERVLLSLERQGVLEATRERRPPHYHVAVFPDHYAGYVARLTGGDRSRGEPPTFTAASSSAVDGGMYEVRRGDSLWSIARSLGVSVLDLRIANGLSSDRIVPGQRLQVPSTEVRMAEAFSYHVQPGDSLWEIARAHGTSVDRIREENSLRNDRIRPGQVLTVPLAR